ncbi:hypothetical protein N7530_012860 [Penicillium desertorum]|uniref:Uncharacterized protein n=2 Tax=Aspergillaceae TaxID=1131492 RepID=A0A9W9WD50_9EURO|nr:hypothetical protein N7530_012860 [Penicillium desertorum]
MSVYSGTLTSRSVHPASPVLLTKNGPLVTHHSNAHVQLSNKGFLRCFNPKASNHSLYLIKLNSRYCYPEGNFGRNQLPDGSISLSPPIPEFDDRFARQNRYEPPPEFPLASPYSGIVHHLRVPTATLLLKSIRRLQDRSMVHPRGFPPPFAFTSRTGLTPEHSRRCSDSLVRVSRRVVYDRYAASEPKRVPRSRQVALHPRLGVTLRRPLTDHPNRRWPARGEVHRHECRLNPASESGRKRFPFNNFTCFLTLFSKCFSSFDHSTCALSVSGQYLALDEIYHPFRAAFPNNSTRRRSFTRARTPHPIRDSHPL